MLYLSGCISKELINSRHPMIGVMSSPEIGNVIPEGMPWAADNACFSQGDKFDANKFLHWLSKQPLDTCLFAVAQDVLADAKRTIETSLPILSEIRNLGVFAAFVGQDNAELCELPWDAFDAWFVGGTTEWKLSHESFLLVKEAIARGKWVHMGRVNSRSRYQLAKAWGCRSVDGTFLAYGPVQNWPRLLSWLDRPYTYALL